MRLFTLWIDAIPVFLRTETFLIHILNQFTRNRKDGDDVLIVANAVQEVSDVTSTGLPASKRCFPRFETVNTAFIGKYEQPVLAEARHDELRGVLVLGRHTC